MRVSNRRFSNRILLALCLVLGSTVLGAGSVQPGYPGSERSSRVRHPCRRQHRPVLVTAPGGAVRRLTTGPAFDACPAFSSDGKQIAGCRDASGGSRSGHEDEWHQPAPGDEHRRSMLLPDFDPAGADRLRGWPHRRSPVRRVLHRGRRERTGPAHVRWRDDLYPAYSPDGTQIAFISYRTGVGQVWLMNVDGSNEHQLTFDAVEKDQVPDWSPDGTRLVYAGGIDFGNFDLYLIEVNGSGLEQITFTPDNDDFAPTWSPDGSRSRLPARARTAGSSTSSIPTAPTSGSSTATRSQFAPAWQPLGDRR